MKNFEGKGMGWTWKSTKVILILNVSSWKFFICSCLLSQANIVAVFIFLTVKENTGDTADEIRSNSKQQ